MAESKFYDEEGVVLTPWNDNADVSWPSIKRFGIRLLAGLVALPVVYCVWMTRSQWWQWLYHIIFG